VAPPSRGRPGPARALPGLVAVAFLLSPATAATLVLDEQEMARAVAAGQRSATSDAPFDGEWRVTSAAGDAAIVVTPFYRLALASRHAAFKNEPLTPAERDKILREQKDRLPFWVVLRGGQEDFARHYTPRFIASGSDGSEREIAPAFVQNERTALRVDGGAFVARCVYAFPTKELTGTSRGALVVRDAGGREIARFSVDLARMR
jgi:hypothetical protein